MSTSARIRPAARLRRQRIALARETVEVLLEREESGGTRYDRGLADSLDLFRVCQEPRDTQAGLPHPHVDSDPVPWGSPSVSTTGNDVAPIRPVWERGKWPATLLLPHVLARHPESGSRSRETPG